MVNSSEFAFPSIIADFPCFYKLMLLQLGGLIPFLNPCLHFCMFVCLFVCLLLLLFSVSVDIVCDCAVPVRRACDTVSHNGNGRRVYVWTGVPLQLHKFPLAEARGIGGQVCVN